MADGDLAAVFKGLAKDAQQAVKRISDKIATFVEDGATRAKASVDDLTTADRGAHDRINRAGRRPDLDVLFRASRKPGAGPKQLYEMDAVRKIAEKYGIDISEMDISLGDVKYRGFQGFTGPDLTTILFVPAFRSEEDLARTLEHELYHRRDLESGKPFPMTEAEKEPWEDRAYAHDQQWWDNHPIRPEPRRR